MSTKFTYPHLATLLIVVAVISFWFVSTVDPQVANTQGSIIYVNANKIAVAGDDGSSWDKAFVKLQDALAAASTGKQIWVAKGIYYLTRG